MAIATFEEEGKAAGGWEQLLSHGCVDFFLLCWLIVALLANFSTRTVPRQLRRVDFDETHKLVLDL